MPIHFSKGIAVDPALVQMLARFTVSDFFLVASSRDKESPHDGLTALQRILTTLGSPFVRVVGIGRRDGEDHTSKRIQITALMLFNDHTESTGTGQTFAKRLREFSREADLPLILHRMRSGPVKLVDIATGKNLKQNMTFEEAIPKFFEVAGGNGFELEMLDRIYYTSERSWWLTPDGKLRPSPEHEYAAREILQGLGLIPAPGRAIYDQMFNQDWVRAVLDDYRITYETSRSQVREANQDQLRSLKALAVECGVGLFNVTTKKVVSPQGIE